MEISAFLVITIVATTIDGPDASTRTVNMQDLCGGRVDKKDAWRLRSHDGVDSTTGDLLQPECTFVLQSLRTGQGFLVSFEEYFVLQDEATGSPTAPPTNGTNSTQFDLVPAGCNSSFLQMWDGDVVDDVSHLVTVCGSREPPLQRLVGLTNDVVESRTQFLTVRLTVHPTATVNVTVVTTSFDSGSCTDDVTELRCRNGRCVPRTVRCDNSNNCGDSTDQLVSPPANCTLATPVEPIDLPWEVLLAVLGGLLAACLLYWLCWRPGYIPWRLACCRNLTRGCFRDCCWGCGRHCACRPYAKGTGRCGACRCACAPKRFGGCCRSNGTGDEASGDDAEGRSRATGNLGQSGRDGGRRTARGSGAVARASYLCCPCGEKGGNGDQQGTGAGQEDWDMRADRDSAYLGDGGHVRESR